MAVVTVKTWGKGRLPQQFIGTEAERVAQATGVPGDVFYTKDEAGSLIAAYQHDGTEWNKFEEYFV